MIENTHAVLRDLIAQRDEIDRRLAELLGRSLPQQERKQKACSRCGQYGHTVRTCATIVGNEKSGAKMEDQAQKESGNFPLPGQQPGVGFMPTNP